MNLAEFRSALAFAATALILGGCAAPETTPAQQHEFRDPAPNEGIVLGSVRVRGGTDLFGRTKWNLLISRLGTDTGYSIEVQRDGAEEVFAIAMPAGTYRAHDLALPVGNFSFKMDARFEVHPGKPLYIGRILVEFPEGLILTVTKIAVSVQDAGNTDVAALQTRHQRQFQDVNTRLAVVGSVPTVTGKTTADARLEKDTIFMVTGMDGATAPECKRRQIVNIQTISADANGIIEHWIVDRCGLPIRYQVTFRRRPQGGTNLFVAPGEIVK